MFDQNVLHIQWLCLAIFGGLTLLMAFILGFMEFWRPREPRAVEIGEDAPVREKWKAAWRIIPMFLILTYVLSFLLTVIYVILKIISPPNW